MLVMRLTDEQAEVLRPLFDAAANAAGLRLPGIIAAQPYRMDDGSCWIRAGFLPHHKAKYLAASAFDFQNDQARQVKMGPTDGNGSPVS